MAANFFSRPPVMLLIDQFFLLGERVFFDKEHINHYLAGIGRPEGTPSGDTIHPSTPDFSS